MNMIENYNMLMYQWLHLYHSPDDSVDTVGLVAGDRDKIERLRHESMQHYTANTVYYHACTPTIFLPLDVFSMWLEGQRNTGASLASNDMIDGDAAKIGSLMRQYGTIPLRFGDVNEVDKVDKDEDLVAAFLRDMAPPKTTKVKGKKKNTSSVS